MGEEGRKIVGYSGGKEDQMSGFWGVFFLGLGVLALIVGIVAMGSSPIWIAVGIAGLVQGVALFILCTAGASLL